MSFQLSEKTIDQHASDCICSILYVTVSGDYTHRPSTSFLIQFKAMLGLVPFESAPHYFSNPSACLEAWLSTKIVYFGFSIQVPKFLVQPRCSYLEALNKIPLSFPWSIVTVLPLQRYWSYLYIRFRMMIFKISYKRPLVLIVCISAKISVQQPTYLLVMIFSVSGTPNNWGNGELY